MKLKDFKKLNENWDKWRSDEPVQEEKKNCGCGQDPCITYGVQNEAVSPEQQEANEKAYSRCFEMGRKGIDVKSALRSGPTADFAACRAGHQDGANEFRQSLPSEHSLEERIKKTVMRKLQEKAKSKNQQQFMGMVKKCQETGDCASAEVKKAADSMKKGDVDDFARTKHKGLPDTVEDKK